MIRMAAITLLVLAFGAPVEGDLPPANTGIMYVSNVRGDAVAVFDGTGAYLRSFPAPGLDGPRGIVVVPEGRLYVASQLSDQIHVFDAQPDAPLCPCSALCKG